MIDEKINKIFEENENNIDIIKRNVKMFIYDLQFSHAEERFNLNMSNIDRILDSFNSRGVETLAKNLKNK